jgi:hypothetical protein
MLMSAVRRSLVLLPVLALVLLAGCRTYGGYGSEEATYNQIQQATRQYATELERAQGDLERLETEAESDTTLEPLVERFQNAVAEHEERLARYRSLANGLSADSGYRELHRVYGTITTEMRMTERRYARVVQRVYATRTGIPADEPAPSRSGYFVEPVDYARTQNAEPLTMRQALQAQSQAASTPATDAPQDEAAQDEAAQDAAPQDAAPQDAAQDDQGDADA